MRKDEHRHVEWRVASPPAVCVGVVCPRSLPAAEHSPAHDDGTGRAEPFCNDLVVDRLGVAAREPVGLAPACEPEGPFVQPLAALAQLEGLVRPGDETVERHRDVELEFCRAHVSVPSLRCLYRRPEAIAKLIAEVPRGPDRTQKVAGSSPASSTREGPQMRASRFSTRKAKAADSVRCQLLVNSGRGRRTYEDGGAVLKFGSAQKT